MFESSMIKDDTSDDVSRIQNPDGAAAWFWSAMAVMTQLPIGFGLQRRNRTLNHKRGALNFGRTMYSIPIGYGLIPSGSSGLGYAAAAYPSSAPATPERVCGGKHRRHFRSAGLTIPACRRQN